MFSISLRRSRNLLVMTHEIARLARPTSTKPFGSRLTAQAMKNEIQSPLVLPFRSIGSPVTGLICTMREVASGGKKTEERH